MDGQSADLVVRNVSVENVLILYSVSWQINNGLSFILTDSVHSLCSTLEQCGVF